jgi:hypothetical protein
MLVTVFTMEEVMPTVQEDKHENIAHVIALAALELEGLPPARRRKGQRPPGRRTGGGATGARSEDP